MNELSLSLRGAILQDFTFVLILLTIVTEVLWIINSPKKHLYAVPLLILLIHMLVYYTWVILFRIALIRVPNAAPVFTDWSVILRFHSILTWLSLEAFRLYTTLQGRAHGQHH